MENGEWIILSYNFQTIVIMPIPLLNRICKERGLNHLKGCNLVGFEEALT